MVIVIYVNVGFGRFQRKLKGMMKNKRTRKRLTSIFAPYIHELVGLIAFKFIGIIDLSSARNPIEGWVFEFSVLFLI